MIWLHSERGSSLLDQSHHLSCSCVCPHEPVLPFPRRGMLMETSWLPDCILKGSCTPAPPFSHLKHYSENTGLRLASQQGAGLLLCQLELHAGAADGKPSRRGWLLKPWCMRAGGGHELFSATLTCVKSDDHLSTPFVDLINYINTFKGPQLTTKLNEALLKLYLLYIIMYVQEQGWNGHAHFSPSEIK